MTALRSHYNLTIDGMELARLCQTVENRVVGAPCGIMDQVTCALGRQDKLVALRCQPHYLLGYERGRFCHVLLPGCTEHSKFLTAYATNERIDRLENRMDERFDGVDHRFNGVDQRLHRVETLLTKHDTRITALEKDR